MSTARCATTALLVLLGWGCGDGGNAPKVVAPAVLRWEARNESGSYGYLVYRSQSREGPFLRINREIVHVVDEADNGSQHYTYTDEDVESGRTYYYYLDLVGQNGKKSRFSGVIAKTVAAD